MTTIVRKIIHIDMDAFYASVEQRDQPDLRGKPVAVGGSKERGVVAAASYEARAFGVRSAMSSKMAKIKCPELIFVKPRFEVYREVSQTIRSIFFDYTDLVEPLSLDEAFLDVSTNKQNLKSATLIAKEIKNKIKQKTGLTASAGISINKFLAKTASDVKKPDGLYVIPPEKAQSFVDSLPIEKFFGVGKVTARKMHELGIRNGFDLKQISKKELIRNFGKTGRYYYEIARAQDHRPVNPHRIRKSIGAENTFSTDLTTMESVYIELDKIFDTLYRRITRAGSKGKTLTVKVKYADFQQITRSRTVHQWLKDPLEYQAIYRDLIENLDLRMGIRLLGLTLSHLKEEHEDKTDELESGQLTFEF